MSNVENKIHFIWLGKTLPKEKAYLILTHLFTNHPDYEVFLWTDKPIENSDLFAKIVNDGGVRDVADNATVTHNAMLDGKLASRRLTFSVNSKSIAQNGNNPARNAGPEKHLTFINVPYHNDKCGLLIRRYEEAIRAHNYGRASDILRVAILKLKGGIYMDTDVTCLRKLPVNIAARNGLLIGRGQAGNDGLTNAVMAAPRNSKTVRDYFNYMNGQFLLFDYNNWFDELNKNIKTQIQLADKAEVEGNEAREKLEKTNSFNIFSRKNLKYKITHADNDRSNAINAFQFSMMASTNAVTGPEALYKFAFFYFIKPEYLTTEERRIFERRMPAIRDAKNAGDYFISLQSAYIGLFANKLKTDEHISITFPQNYLKIGSDVSWIENARR